MNKKVKILLIICLSVLGTALGLSKADASILSVAPLQQNFSPGDTFNVDIHINSENQVINAVAAELTYPTDLLEVADLGQGGSFLSLWVTAPTVDRETGTISLLGGIPGGSYVVDGKVASITFRAKKQGTAKLAFNQKNCQVTANDGQGTATSVKFMDGAYAISSISSQSVIIDSPSHPNENKWYDNNELTVTWAADSQKFYSYSLSTDPLAAPDDNAKKVVGQVTFSRLSDGLYYFVLNEKVPAGDWRFVGRRQIKIDSTPPQRPQLDIAQETTMSDNQYFLVFSSFDVTSGIDYYQISEGDQKTEMVSGPYILKDQARASKIVVTAFDRAGNSTSSADQAGSASPSSKPNSLYLSIVLILSAVVLMLGFVSGRLQKKQ